MKLKRSIELILALACVQSALAQEPDTLWLCRDSIPDGSPAKMWFRMYLADTFPDCRGNFEMVDTGVSQDGSKYVNFDYRFSNDSVFIKGTDPFMGTDTIYHCAPRPGYAGFKFYWDNGFVTFNATAFDSMILWHKGPLPGHKVKIVWGRGGDIDGLIAFQEFGEYKPSAVWKKEAIAFPPTFIRAGLFELRMLIYNDTGTSPTSDPGCLKIDNIAFIKRHNNAPLFTSIPVTTAIEGQPYSYTVTTADPDMGDIVTLSLVTAPSGMIISNGFISWTPAEQQVGNNTVVVRAQDNRNASTNQSFTVTVANVNYPPRITSAPVTIATQNTPYGYQVTVSDPDADDTHAYLLLAAPTGMTISASGMVSWNPTAQQVANHTVRLRVTDAAHSYAEQTYTIAVANVNDPPCITSAPPTIATQDLPYTYLVQVSDPDLDLGDGLTWQLLTFSTGMSMSAAGTISWTPMSSQIGVHSVKLKVSDASQASDSQSYQIIVSNINDPPVITTNALRTATEDDSFSDTLKATDTNGNPVFWSLLSSPAGMNISFNSGVITWTPVDSQNGNNTVRVMAADGVLSDTATFTIFVTAINDPPVITSVIPQIFGTDSLYSIPLMAIDEEDIPITWTVADKPSNMQLITSTLVWTPNISNVGMDMLVVIASDGVMSDTLRQALLVINDSRSILVTSPNGGENWTGAKLYDITWSSIGAISRVCIELSLDSGKTWLALAAGVTNNGRYRCTVPNAASVKCLVRVADSADTLIRDTSNGVFSIVPSTASRSARRPLPSSSGLTGIKVDARQGIVTVLYALAQPGEASMNIYSVKGRLIRRIAAKSGAGYYTMTWNGRDECGSAVAVGMYIVRVKIGGANYDRMVVMAR